MKEISATSVQIKLSDGHEDQYVLVHDGKQVIELLSPQSGKVGTPVGNTMLAGTKEEIDAEIARLKLQPKRSGRVTGKTSTASKSFGTPQEGPATS